jgi:hypothetical protein
MNGRTDDYDLVMRNGRTESRDEIAPYESLPDRLKVESKTYR